MAVLASQWEALSQAEDCLSWWICLHFTSWPSPGQTSPGDAFVFWGSWSGWGQKSKKSKRDTWKASSGAAVDVDNPQSHTLAAIGVLRNMGSCFWPPPFKQQSSLTGPWCWWEGRDFSIILFQPGFAIRGCSAWELAITLTVARIFSLLLTMGGKEKKVLLSKWKMSMRLKWEYLNYRNSVLSSILKHCGSTNLGTADW